MGIAFDARKRRQPGFTTDRPAFIRWRQPIRLIQAAQVHFDFIAAEGKDGGAATRAETAPGVVANIALDHHRLPREYRGGEEQGAMMLAAVETVAKADPTGVPHRLEADIAT